MSGPNSYNGWCNEGSATQLPPGGSPPLAAGAQAGQGQFLTYNSAGNAFLNDGTTPCVYSAGAAWPEKLSATSAVAGAATLSVWTGYGSGAPMSSESGDAFTAADVCTPAWLASTGVLGKLSSLSGVNRPLMGLVHGLAADGTPRSWVGPDAQAVARGVMIADAFKFARFNIADAAASTAIAERTIDFAAVHGRVVSVKFSGAAIAADNTDYATITISKRSLATDYGTAVSVATFDTRAANQGAITAFVPASFLLSVVAGTTDLLETDILTIVTTKPGAGKTLTGTILVNGKAI